MLDFSHFEYCQLKIPYVFYICTCLTYTEIYRRVIYLEESEMITKYNFKKSTTSVVINNSKRWSTALLLSILLVFFSFF